MAVSDPTVNVTPSSFAEIREPITFALLAMLSSVQQSSAITLDWKKELVILSHFGKRKRTDSDITLLSVPVEVLSHLLLMRIQHYLT